MKRYLLAACAALALGGAAHAGTWWTLDSRTGTCVPASVAVATTRDPAFASPFALAAEMRAKGRLDAPVDQKRTRYGSGYAVMYDGATTAFFTSKPACRDFLGFAQGIGDLPK